MGLLVAPDLASLERPGAVTPASSVRTLRGMPAAVLLFSYYPADPRPRRAAEALAGEGLLVDVICLRRNGERARETVNGVSVLRIPLKRRRGGALAYLVQYAAFILACGLVLAVRSIRTRYRLVHVHNMPDVLVFSALIPKALGAKVVLDLHDPMPELMQSMFPSRFRGTAVTLLEQLERWSIHFADLVFTVNIACQRIFSSRACRPDKIRVIMNSPDERVFAFKPSSRSDARSQRFVIMYHGSMVERNGLDLAISALPLVRRDVPEAELRIYGDSTPFLEGLLAQVERDGLRHAVHYCGARTLPGIVAAIDDCDVGVIPNRMTRFTEINTPTRIFEYLARGKPVVAGRGAGVLDYFPDDALFFFKLGDVEDLAATIVRVAHGRDEVDRVLERGQEIYMRHRWTGQRGSLIESIASVLTTAPISTRVESHTDAIAR